MRIGLLSDTHQNNRRPELWDEVREAFAGADLILHAGDIVAPGVLDWLEQIAPTLAAQGNNDLGWDDSRMRERHSLEFEGWRIAMVHDMEPEERPIELLVERFLDGQRPDVIFTGHTHYERLEHRDDVLQINSGSPTQPHLFSPRLGTVGLLELSPSSLRARVLRLGETPGRRNPGHELEFD